MSRTTWVLLSPEWLPVRFWRPGIEAAISKHAFPSSWMEKFDTTFAVVKTNTIAKLERTFAKIRMLATQSETLISFLRCTWWHHSILIRLNGADWIHQKWTNWRVLIICWGIVSFLFYCRWLSVCSWVYGITLKNPRKKFLMIQLPRKLIFFRRIFKEII